MADKPKVKMYMKLRPQERTNLEKEKDERERARKIQNKAIVDGYIYAALNDPYWAAKLF
jgi:hypothetical protein